jgi:tetratricopeptide (TPR) repeat protein
MLAIRHSIGVALMWQALSSMYMPESDPLYTPYAANFIQIVKWATDLYISDYRVRGHIYRELERKVRCLENSGKVGEGLNNAAFQLAVCNKIGFGGYNDDDASRQMLVKSGRSQKELDEAVQTLHSWDRKDSQFGAVFGRPKGLRQSSHVESTESEIFYGKIDRLKEVEAHLTHEIRDMERSGGPHSRPAIELCSYLSRLFAVQGRWKEAGELDFRAMLTRKKNLGQGHISTMIDADNLTVAYLHQGRREEAEKLQRELLDSKARVLGDKSPQTLISMNLLTGIYLDQGRLDVSERIRRRFITLSDGESGESLSSIRDILEGIPVDQHLPGESETLQSRNGTFAERDRLDDHSTALTALSNLATMYYQQRRLREAEVLSGQVLETRKRIHGLEHRATLIPMKILALIYLGQDRIDEAVSLGTQVLEIRQRICGLCHPETLVSMNTLATCYIQQRRLKDAEALGRQAVEIGRQIHKPEQYDNLKAKDVLSVALIGQGRTTEAVALLKPWIENNSTGNGTNHDTRARCIGAQATVMAWQCEFEESAKLRRAEIEALVGMLGPRHPTVLQRMYELAIAIHAQGKVSEAIDLQEQCLQLRQEVLGLQNHQTNKSYHTLKRWQNEQQLQDISFVSVNDTGCKGSSTHIQ